MLAISVSFPDNLVMPQIISPEIRAWYIPRVLPIGGAPDYIKKGWIDVPLPLRYELSDNPTPELVMDAGFRGLSMFSDAVRVTANDAAKSLRIFQRGEALGWWREYFLKRPQDLAFEIQEGDEIVQDSELRQILPGLSKYDKPSTGINFDIAVIHSTGRQLDDDTTRALADGTIERSNYSSFTDSIDPLERAKLARGIVEVVLRSELDTTDPNTLAAIVEFAMWNGEQAFPRTSQ